MTATIVSTLDLRQISPPQRHALIFSTFEALQPGQALELVNDHNPAPLNSQFEIRAAGQFSWDALESGPEVWRVQIGKMPKPRALAVAVAAAAAVNLQPRHPARLAGA